MSEDMVMVNELSREGTRTIHVARMGQAPDREGWVGKLPAGAHDSLAVTTWVDGMEVHHLLMVWNARELTPFAVEGEARQVLGVLWWLGPASQGISFRAAVKEAAERYFLDFGVDAGAVVCREAPKGAPRGDGKPLPVKIEALGEILEMELIEAYWAPRRAVALFRDGEEALCLIPKS